MGSKFKKMYLASAVGALALIAGCTSNDDSNGTGSSGSSGRFQEGAFGFSEQNTPPLMRASTPSSEITVDRATDLAVTALSRAASLMITDRLTTRQLDFYEQAYQDELGSGTEDCQTGTLTTSQSDVAPTALLSSGDALDFTLNGCDGQTGALGFRFDKYTGSINGVLDAQIRVLADLNANDAATGLVTKEVGQTDRSVSRGSGGVITQGNLRNINIDIKRENKEASAKISGGFRNSFATPDSTLSEASISYLEDGKAPGSRVIAGTDSSYRFNAPVVTFDVAERRFTSGVISIEAKGNIRMNVLSSEAVRIDLDQQKDGQFERTCTFSYDALLAGQAAFTQDGGCQGVANPGGGGGGGGDPVPENPLDQIPVLGPLVGSLPVIGDILGSLLNR